MSERNSVASVLKWLKSTLEMLEGNLKIQANAIVWSNGVDFAPEFIKELIL